MKTYVLFLFSLFLLEDISLAEEVLLYRCNEPKGMRVDWGNYYNFLGENFQSLEDGAKWREDGFSNISPFVSIGRSEMTVYWGNSRPDGIDEYVPYSTKAHIMPIIGKTANSVWGIRQQAKTVEIFRFYKKQMLLYRIISSVGLAIAEMDGTLPSMASIHIIKCEAATT